MCEKPKDIEKLSEMIKRESLYPPDEILYYEDEEGNIYLSEWHKKMLQRQNKPMNRIIIFIKKALKLCKQYH